MADLATKPDASLWRGMMVEQIVAALVNFLEWTNEHDDYHLIMPADNDLLAEEAARNYVKRLDFLEALVRKRRDVSA